MALLGIDVGRDLAISNAQIVELGVNWVRAPISPNADVQQIRERIRHLAQRRVKTALVIDSTAVGGSSFAEAAAFYADAYGGVVGAFECGNEADAGWDGTRQLNDPDGNRAE